MNAFWILMAFWIGVVLGFGVFALMQVAREGSDKAEREIDALPRGVPLGVRRNRQAMGRYGELAASR